MAIRTLDEEIKVLDELSRSSKGNLAILYDSLKRINEIMISLTHEEKEELRRDVGTSPILSSFLSEATTVDYSESSTSESPSSFPPYLTVKDVAEMLGVSEQAVRGYCANGKVEAWRTLGDSGQWRIDTKQYKKHPGIKEAVERYYERNSAASKYIASNEHVVNQLHNAKAHRHDPTYHNNDPERFARLISENDG